MPDVKCPIPGCSYRTGEFDAAIAAALLTAHIAVHSAINNAARYATTLRENWYFKLVKMISKGLAFSTYLSMFFPPLRLLSCSSVHVWCA